MFARVSPKHKLSIVTALQKRRNVVAMTGDGVNDAPAVKQADIGVSMGITGTDVTKEASDLILLDDNFATLVNAVREGRAIYANIRKFIRYLLSCNIGEVITMFLGMLMGMPVVLLPIQILLINLVTDGLPAIALGLEPPDKNTMNVRPRKKNDGVFSDCLLYTSPKDYTILQAAHEAGIEIPTLCYLKDINEIGACRTVSYTHLDVYKRQAPRIHQRWRPRRLPFFRNQTALPGNGHDPYI